MFAKFNEVYVQFQDDSPNLAQTNSKDDDVSANVQHLNFLHTALKLGLKMH